MATLAQQTALSVKADIAAASSLLSDIQQRSIPTATRQGLNRAIMSVRGLAVKSISRDTGIKQKDVRSELEVIKAHRNQALPRAEIRVMRRAKAINLIEFVTPGRRKPSAGEGKPQFFRRRSKKRVRKGGKRVSMSASYKHKGVEAKPWRNRKTFKSTFIIDTTNGPRVMRRTGGSRGKLTQVSGPSVKASFAQPAIDRAMKSRAHLAFAKEFNRALHNDLRRRGLGG